MKKILLTLLVLVSIFAFTACRAEVEVRRYSGPESRYKGPVINESDHALRIKVIDESGRSPTKTFTLYPDERVYLKLYSGKHVFEARYKYFDDFFARTSLYIEEKRDNVKWKTESYNWYAVFRRPGRIRTDS